VTARDGDRRTQQVRGVADEVALALGSRADLAHGGLAPAGVPDHGDEHGAHQRHFGHLVDAMAGLQRALEQRGAGGHTDHREHDAGRARRPDAEAVEDRQADPDEVERDGLPLVQPEHHRTFAAAKAPRRAQASAAR